MKPAISIAEAATLLNVSEEHLDTLISKGAFSTTAGGIELPRDEVLAYRAARNEQREGALDEMVALAEEHDLPY